MVVLSVGFVGGASYLGWNYYTTTQETIATLTKNNTELQNSVDTMQETLKKIKEDSEKQKVLIEDLNKAQREAEVTITNLQNLLSKHDLTNLAKQKPGLIQQRIQNATNQVFRGIECDSGAC